MICNFTFFSTYFSRGGGGGGGGGGMKPHLESRRFSLLAEMEPGTAESAGQHFTNKAIWAPIIKNANSDQSL